VFNPVFVTENMVGHRLGEFSLTRTFKKHGAHTAKAEANSTMQVHAILKNVRMSAQKMREVVRQIQGLPALQAAGGARRCSAQGRAVVAKTLDSAIANAENNNNVKGGKVDREGSRRRDRHHDAPFHPKARGSAGPILKRNCHIKITLSDE